MAIGSTPSASSRGDEDQVAAGLRHLLAVQRDHPGMACSAGRTARRRSAPRRARPNIRGAGRSDRCHRPARRWSGPAGCRRSPRIRCASRAAPAPSATPRTAHPPLGSATAAGRAGSACPAGPGRRRVRRTASAWWPGRTGTRSRTSGRRRCRSRRPDAPGRRPGRRRRVSSSRLHRLPTPRPSPRPRRCSPAGAAPAAPSCPRGTAGSPCAARSRQSMPSRAARSSSGSSMSVMFCTKCTRCPLSSQTRCTRSKAR